LKAVKLNLIIAVGLVLLLCTPVESQFVKVFGGFTGDYGISVVQTSDGGLVVTGATFSFGAVAGDLLLSKFDASGNHLWSRTLGGTSFDQGCSVVQSLDGGFVVTGYTNSFGVGGDDLLLSKFDASGNHLWSRTLGGSSDDYGISVVQTPDGGFVVTGYTNSFGAGGDDLLLSKFDASGNHLWSRTLGGSSDDYGQSVVQTSDGGLVVTGATFSFGAGGDHLLLSKFDVSGNHLWSRTLGGSSGDYGGQSVVQTSDGGFVVTGYTNSFGAGWLDVLLSKFDASGNYLWTRILGGTGWDVSESVVQTSDGGFVVTGYTNSFGAGGDDLLLSKFDASGNHLWSRTLGGTSFDQGYSVVQSLDGGFVVTGYTSLGAQSLLLSKFDASGNTCMGEFVTPTVQSITPTVTSPIPTITMPSPTITSPIPTVTSPTPPITTVCEEFPFIRGDVNGDGLVNHPDICFLKAYLFIGGSIPCQDAADVNDDGIISSADMLYLINYLNLGGLPPPPPFPSPGSDPTPDGLDCAGTGPFICGDANNDGVINSADVAYLINYPFVGGPPPDPRGTGNANCDEIINSSDVSYLINYLFVNGPKPSGP
jgi:hypothetical protein